MKTRIDNKPFVYSCSGCSSAVQMASYMAVKSDRMGVAEMYCIAGVEGNVKNDNNILLINKPFFVCKRIKVPIKENFIVCHGQQMTILSGGLKLLIYATFIAMAATDW